MKKGQSTEERIKNTLKFFKMNENAISTTMGIVVVLVTAGLIFNYFRTTNLKTWQGILLDEASKTSIKDDRTNEDPNLIATHKVVKGDDLWHISEKYYKSGYNYVDIMKENKISGKGVIATGMELRIPKVDPKKITAIDTKKEIELSKTGDVVKPTAIEEQPIAIGKYTTKKGDTYWQIAVRAYGDGFKWPKVYWANRAIFRDPDIIHTGVEITVPKLSE